MKKTIIAMAAAAAAFTMVSCKRELVEPEAAPVAGNDIITAYTGNGLTKTSLSGNDYMGYKVVWSEGDEITIGGNPFVLTEGAGTTAGKFRGTLPKDGTYTAYYPSTYDDCTWPNEQKYAKDNITGSPMKAEVTISGGNLSESLKFTNVGGILRLTVKGVSAGGVKTIKVYAEDLDDITLHCDIAAEDNADEAVFHIAMPAGEYSGASIFLETYNRGYCIKKLKSDKSLVIESSKITRASFSANLPPRDSTDPLPGEFTVADGKTVHFSKGNLRYYVENPKYPGVWCFFDKQYESRSELDEWETEISLFTWGYNAEKSILPHGKTSDNVDITSGNLSLDQDWGSRIGNGESWRTLTSAEWQYLFKTRENATKKYGLATVGEAKGLIILPDTFTDPMKNHGYGAFKPNTTSSRWDDNEYTIGGNWEAMEHAGAVFLPVAGYRNGNETYESNIYGYYWSSSAYDESNANIISYGAGNLRYDHFNRSYGSSVRLVTNGLFTVTFDLNGGPGGTAPKSIENILRGSLIPRPSNVFVSGKLVVGWYKDKACTTKWNFDSDKVTENTTLYAKWDKIIWGKFTVNNKGKKVCFTRSNVWADDSNNLHFEDNQWDFNSKYEGSHVSHFLWCQTVSEAKEVSCSDKQDYLFCSKGHKVSVDGSDKIFYALSDDEWVYLLEGREMAVLFRYTSNITYNGQNGLVIYDDDYIGQQLSAATAYTEENFPSGCIFLPGAGWRQGDTVRPAGDSNGFYWSSGMSITPTESGVKIEPFFLQFTKEYVQRSNNGDINSGMSIRLVADVE